MRVRRGIGWLPAGAVVLMGLAVACGSGDERPQLEGSGLGNRPTVLCNDADGDGFGVGCSKGPDCDDDDAEVGVECHCGDEPSPSCPCDDPGVFSSCGRAYSQVGQQIVCGDGFMTCSGGVWGECVINNAISLAPRLKELGLGGAEECTTNPCSPTCQTFVDTPGDIGFDDDDGLSESDDGITLSGEPGTGGPSLTATFGCEGGDYPTSDGACAHHLCETGDPLDPSCDETPGSTETLTLFSDDFSNDNAQGWTMDATWEIDEATSSSGHTVGDNDPWSDASPTNDDKVAGTNIGGNIGGGSVLFSDSFSNLNDWTESGGWNWDAESRHSSSGYPSSGSGSNVAGADNCDNSCTITLEDSIDLSGYSSATLDLLRFLDNKLDGGEYLRLDAWNGSSWSTLANWEGGSDDDNTWHSASFDLSSYLVSDFRIRFVTKTSKDDEHVQVDDVVISAPPTTQTRWLTSPAFDATAASGDVTLNFERWLNIEGPGSREALVEVFDGSDWVNLWTNTSAHDEDSWSAQSFDLTPYKNAAMQVRFGWSGAATSIVSGWNLDDVVVTGENTLAAQPGCVQAICDAEPSCCDSAWTSDCLELIETECQILCSIDTATDECVACHGDSSDTVDYDGDGYSAADGDCLECDATVNPGAFDVDNGVDDNCDGTIDNGATGCDAGLSPGGDAWAHAQAIGLCKVASDGGWGVVDAEFVRADGTTSCSDPLQRYIVSDFGSGNDPLEGSTMAVYSSGTARDSGDPGYIQPNGNGYDANTTSTPAYSVPAASGCNAGTAGRDSCGLKLTIRAPTNVNSFSFNFNFFTSEYPEWLCTSYNDSFVAYYEGVLNTASNKNISFDSLSNPVSVNNGFFDIPGWPPPSSGSNALLDGTGYDGVCNNNYGGSTYTSSSICGGATGWLTTTAPVLPGEDIVLHFNVWDTGDHKWDSTVLLDNFLWSAETATVQTGRYEPGDGGVTGDPLEPASFERDYDASGLCDLGQHPTWTFWSWAATTPDDSSIEFFVKTAASEAELDTAQETALVFNSSLGPASLVGDDAVAQLGAEDTQNGTVIVQEALQAAGLSTDLNFVRVRSYLVPSSDGLSSPTLQSWNLQMACEDAE